MTPTRFRKAEPVRLRTRLKRIVWFGFSLFLVEGIVLGVYCSLPNTHPTELQMFVITVATVTVVGGFTTLAKKTSDALRTREALRLGREDFDKNYRKLLIFAPTMLGLMSIASGLQWVGFSIGADTGHHDLLARWIVTLSFLVSWGMFFAVFAGKGRKDVEDEMVAAHRNQAYQTGFIASAFTGLALAVLLVLAPKTGLGAVPPFLPALPLIIAMVRLGLLERAAASDA